MGSRTSNKPETARSMRSKGAVALCLAAAAGFVIASEASAGQGPDDVNVQAGWVFLLACRADGRLTVSLIHTEQFPFPLKPLFLVKLQSNNVPTALIEAKSVENNQILVAPL